MVDRAVNELEQIDPARAATMECLLLQGDLASRIERILESAYPDEGCGVLVGRVEGNWREVIRAVSSKNTWDERSDRYRVDPELVHRLMRAEQEGGLGIVGFFHSHPDADPLPSATDRDLAWPWYHYVIWPVRRGVAGHPRGWRLAKTGFVEIDLRPSSPCLD